MYIVPRWRFELAPFVSKQSTKFRHLAVKIENDFQKAFQILKTKFFGRFFGDFLIDFQNSV